MKYLMEQSEFEILIGKNPDIPAPAGVTIIYFTATWCGACRRLDMNLLEATFGTANWLKCDVDQNQYTGGYCGVRAIPAFVVVRDGKYLGMYQSSTTMEVVNWLHKVLS
jgi:thioredoxin-like negative regulator of GroEL